MTVQAILFDFNGVIINDERLHQQLTEDILLGENLRCTDQDYQDFCLGKSERQALRDVLLSKGRVVSDAYLDKLLELKSQSYRQVIAGLNPLPLYEGVKDCLATVKAEGLSIGLVTGSSSSEVEFVLSKSGIRDYFEIVVTGDQISTSKPDPQGYLIASNYLQVKPGNCLVIEDSSAGIQAAKSAGMKVVGVANTRPVHMLQRQVNWTVDRLEELEWDRILVV